jgi:hypothetical protein
MYFGKMTRFFLHGCFVGNGLSFGAIGGMPSFEQLCLLLDNIYRNLMILVKLLMCLLFGCFQGKIDGFQAGKIGLYTGGQPKSRDQIHIMV